MMIDDLDYFYRSVSMSHRLSLPSAGYRAPKDVDFYSRAAGRATASSMTPFRSEA